MQKKFEMNRTRIKGGCQSWRKVVIHNSKSDMPLHYIKLFCSDIYVSKYSICIMLTSNGGRGWSFCGWGCWRCNGMLIWWWPRRPPLCCNLVLRFSSSSSEESPSSSESSSESTPEAVVATSRSEHWMAGSDRDLDGVRWVEWLGNFYVHQSDKERGKKWIQYYEVDFKNIGKKQTLEQLIYPL